MRGRNVLSGLVLDKKKKR